MTENTIGCHEQQYIIFTNNKLYIVEKKEKLHQVMCVNIWMINRNENRWECWFLWWRGVEKYQYVRCVEYCDFMLTYVALKYGNIHDWHVVLKIRTKITTFLGFCSTLFVLYLSVGEVEGYRIVSLWDNMLTTILSSYLSFSFRCHRNRFYDFSCCGQWSEVPFKHFRRFPTNISVRNLVSVMQE